MLTIEEVDFTVEDDAVVLGFTEVELAFVEVVALTSGDVGIAEVAGAVAVGAGAAPVASPYQMPRPFVPT